MLLLTDYFVVLPAVPAELLLDELPGIDVVLGDELEVLLGDEVGLEALDVLLGDMLEVLLGDDGVDVLLGDMLDVLLGEVSLLDVVLEVVPLPEIELADAPWEELPDSETPSAVSVCESSVPDALMPCFCWNCFSALRVCGPILPSALTFMPLSLSACWAWRISDESLELAPLDESIEEVLWSIDDTLLLAVDVAPVFEALGEVDCGVPVVANAAVLERTSAARVSLRRFMVMSSQMLWGRIATRRRQRPCVADGVGLRDVPRVH